MQYQAYSVQPPLKSVTKLGSSLIAAFKKHLKSQPRHVLLLVSGTTVCGYFVPVPARYASDFKNAQKQIEEDFIAHKFTNDDHVSFFDRLNNNGVLQLRHGAHYDDNAMLEDIDQYLCSGSSFGEHDSMDVLSDCDDDELKMQAVSDLPPSLNIPNYGIDYYGSCPHTPSRLPLDAGLSPYSEDDWNNRFPGYSLLPDTLPRE